MSRYNHFRQWLKEQSPRSAAAVPSPARARYTLPEYRLPPTVDAEVRAPLPPAPRWAEPQSGLPPILPSHSSPSPESASASLPPLPSPHPQGGAVMPPYQVVYSASLGERQPSSPSRHSVQPPPLPPAERSAAPGLRHYSYGLVILVWLGLLGLGGYAVSRLLDPVYVTTQVNSVPSRSTPDRPTVAPPSSQPSQPSISPHPVTPPAYDAPPSTSTAIASSVPTPFDYADATPRPNTSPIWALVAVITASALGSRLMGQQAQRSRHR